MKTRKKRALLRVGATVLLAFAAVALGLYYSTSSSARQEAKVVAFNLTERSDVNDQPLTVKVVHPKRDPSFTIAVQQLASVEPYFVAELRSKVAGPIKYLHKAIGDRVAKDEVLVEIDVPDQFHDLAQKEKVIDEKYEALRLSQARVKLARAALEIATQSIVQRRADLEKMEALRAYRKKRLDRFAALKLQQALDPFVVEEEEHDYQSAEAACRSAALAIRKAETELEEKEANVSAALADVELRQAFLEVARKDRDRALAFADYSRIRAPFDGVITERTVDLGDFVQSASTARTEPLLTIARADVVTVAMKVPDNDAPFVGTDTEAIIQLDEFPGIEIHGRVTRFSSSILDVDRTMRVEVDLFNGTQAEYQHYVARSLNALLAPLGRGKLPEALPLVALQQQHWRGELKGIGDSFPLLPRRLGGEREFAKLMPGMSGYMRLLLQKFRDSYLIPSGAVFSRGGKPYILIVDNNKAHRLPVRVQVNDGKLAKVVVLEATGTVRNGDKEATRELTGAELIVIGRQMEIGEGQIVRTELDDSWHRNAESLPGNLDYPRE